MKDFLVVFTEGVDRYNLNKQLKNFKDSYIREYNCKADFDILYETAKEAYESGYDSFHYLTESSDWADLDFEFKKEFYMFESAGVIKGNYGLSKLTEAVVNTEGQDLVAIFPANFASFQGEEIKKQFVDTLIEYFQKPFARKFLFLPVPQGNFSNKSAGLTAGEAYALFNDIAKIPQLEQSITNNKVQKVVVDLNNGYNLIKDKNYPTIIGPNDLIAKLQAGSPSGNQTGPLNSKGFEDYANRENANLTFSNTLNNYITKLKSESEAEPLNEEDKKIINNIKSTVTTPKQNYVINCFNTAIYNITNNIDITNNTQINVSIGSININNGMQVLGDVTNILLDVNGNLEATQGTIYNSAIKALQYGARRTFTNRDKAYQNGAEAKAALSKMLGGVDIDDSYETNQLNKSATLANDITNRSAANAKLNQDARLSKMNIKDAEKKIEILSDKLEAATKVLNSATDDKSKQKAKTNKEEIEQELMNAKAQLAQYQKHQQHNQNLGDIEKIKQIQYDRGQDAAGLSNRNSSKGYSNMGDSSDDKTKVQKAKNIAQGKEVNQKMNAKLLTQNPKTGTRQLDELAKALV